MNDAGDGGKNKYLVPGLTLLGGLAGLRAGRDFGAIKRLSRNWVVGTQQASKAIHKNPEDAINVVKTYVDLGRPLMQSKVLGMPVPYMATRALRGPVAGGGNPAAAILEYIKKKPARSWDRITRGKGAERSRFLKGQDLDQPAHSTSQGMLDHYRKFYSKELTNRDVYNHHMFAPMWWRMSQQGRNILSNPNKTTMEALKELKRVNPAEHKEALQSIMVRGRASGGVGGVGGGGFAHMYGNAGVPIAGIAQKISTGLGLVGSSVGTVGLMGAAASDLNKKASADNNVSLPAYIFGGLGAHSLYSAAESARSPFTVGASWSELTRHGDGHKNPGKAIFSILEDIKQKDPQFRRMTLDKAIRHAHGGADITSAMRKYDAFFDSGMGVTSSYNWEASPHDDISLRKALNPENKGAVQGLGKPPAPRIRPGGYVGYQTDVGLPGAPAKGYLDRILAKRPWRIMNVLNGNKDQYMTWGPRNLYNDVLGEGTTKGFRHLFNERHLGQGMPAMTEGATKAIAEANASSKAQLIDKAINSDAFTPEQKQILEKAKGKKLVAFTGAGRGDYTAERVRDFQRAVKRSGGNLDDYVILAATGQTGASNPAVQALKNSKNVVTVGRLPQNLYIGLPAVADMHSAATGTSGAFEALSTKAPLAVTQDWGDLKVREQRRMLGRKNFDKVFSAGTADEFQDAFDSFSKRRQRYWGDAGRLQSWVQETSGVDLDNWNKGNRLYMNQMGASKVQSGEDLLAALKKSTSGSEIGRANEVFGNAAKAKESMRKHILEVLRRQKSMKTLRTGGGVIGGLGMLGLAAHDIFGNTKKD